MNQLAFDELPIAFLLPVNPENPSSSFSFFPPNTRSQQEKPKIKTYAERKAEIVGKIHSLPLKEYYSKETLSNWSIPRLHKELKVNDVKFCLSGKCGEHNKSDEKKELVDKVFNINFKEGETGSSCESCTICCDDYEDEEVLRTMKCGHAFHVECIDKWAITAAGYTAPPKCPVCNTHI